MKTRLLLLAILTLAVSSLYADYFSPFADSPVGTAVTDHGQIFRVVGKTGGTNYFVRFWTDTGPHELPAEIPPKLIRNEMFGRRTKITVTIRLRDDAENKSKKRYLEVTGFEIVK